MIFSYILLLMTVILVNVVNVRSQQTCLSNPQLNEVFVNANGGTSIPTEGSCCMKDVCNIPCPQTLPGPSIGYGIAVGVALLIAFVLGVATYVLVKGEAVNYFVAGKTFPMWMVAITLGAASVDSNALLGNVDLSYKLSFWDGVVLPLGLGGSLFLNAFTLGPKLNAEPNMLTLPDAIGNRYGVIVEVLCSVCCIVSFLMLLAGNLVGTGVITSYVWGTTQTAGIWIAAVLIWSFTVAGGLFSIAYTDVALGAIGWTGCLICAFWLIANATSKAPVVSIGFPGYMYPTTEACEMYNGTACANDATQCCYNEALWCPSEDNCRTDNGAYPYGDKWYYKGQMTDPYALTPFPNGIFWNWATIIILTFGNLAALDYQVRCLASKTPEGAKWGCIIGGSFTLLIGVPFGLLGGITRYYYGPDSVYAEFDVDTCSTILGLPTCGAWVPDPTAFMKLLTYQTPPWMGAWCMVGIIAASLSTANGAILAMGTVFAHNIMRQLDAKWPNLVTTKNLLLMARLSTIPFTILSALIASSSKKTGYLLIVAFDVVLASVVPALVAAFYLKNPSSRAALCSVVSGIIIRVTLEFTLPKDGSLILPFSGDEFMNYGKASSTKLPTFVDGADNEVWDPTTEVCAQEQYKDYTGVDSLSAFAGSIIVLLTVYFIEQHFLDGRPLFVLPGMVGYYKKIRDDDDSETKKIDSATKINFSKSGILEMEDDIDHKSVKDSESETGQGVGSSDEGDIDTKGL